MYRLRYRRLGLVSLLLALCSGCAPAQYAPRIQLTVGDIYTLIIDQTEEDNATINSIVFREVHKVRRLYELQVKEAPPGGGAVLAITYKSFKFSSSTRIHGIEIPLLKNRRGHTPNEEVARIVAGRTFTIEFGADGSVLNVRGLDDLQKTIKEQINVRDFAGIATANPDQIKRYEKRLFALESPGHAAITFGEVFSVLPGIPVAVGDTWNVPRLEDAFGEIYYDRSVSATRVEGRKLHASLTATMGSLPGAQGQFTGQASSTLAIDLDTGLVMMQKLEESFSGSNVNEGLSSVTGKVTTTMEILKMSN